MILFIPSPSISSFQIGPLTIHIYALCLITGIIAAWIIGLRRWRARGGRTESFETVLIWTIPLGIVGARIYHVLTHLGDYFSPGATQHWWAIWEGGIAIYGAVGFGALACWWASRRQMISFTALADSLAPGIAIGQAFGRLATGSTRSSTASPPTCRGGWRSTPAHRAPGFEQYATFHPTFLYESIWNLLVAGITLWADRKFRLGRGKVFALYIALYGFGRIFTEHIRLDYSGRVRADPLQRGGGDADLPRRDRRARPADEVPPGPRGRRGVRPRRSRRGRCARRRRGRKRRG